MIVIRFEPISQFAQMSMCFFTISNSIILSPFPPLSQFFGLNLQFSLSDFFEVSTLVVSKENTLEFGKELIVECL